ncbi:MAG: hypothetical protein H6697_12285 [Myxococcales bacterium]|nr:hypothetical protein [Myxococcales bacterium]MCB9520512.1 hypothetical protein [Myxococcales bacterium]
MSSLTTRDEKVIRTLAVALLSRGGAISADAIDARVVPRVDTWMGRLNRIELTKVRALFHMFDLYYAVHALNPFARMTSATPDQVSTYLATWEQSDMYARRLAFQGVRQILSIAYMEDRGVRAEMGMTSETDPSAHFAQLAEAASLLRAGASAPKR